MLQLLSTSPLFMVLVQVNENGRQQTMTERASLLVKLTVAHH